MSDPRLRKRIQVYVDDETKRRIELAALVRETPVTEYCLDAIRQRLAEDDVLEQGRIEVDLARTAADDLTVRLSVLRARILERRDGAHLDAGVVGSERDERDGEILGLR